MSASDPTTRVEYRQIEWLVGYRFGDDGSIWSRWFNCWGGGRGSGGVCKLTDTWRQRKTKTDRRSGRYGYAVLEFMLDGPTGRKRVKRFVHHLMLEAFVGPREPGQECRHLDGDPSNNRPDNLAWGTHAENEADKRQHGTILVAEACPWAKLSWAKAAEIRKAKAEGVSARELASRFDVSISSIRLILWGRMWIAPPSD